MMFILIFSIIGVIAVNTFHVKSKEVLFAEHDTLTQLVADDLDYKLQTSQRALVALASIFPLSILDKPDEIQKFLDQAVGTKILFDRSLFIFSPKGDLVAETPFLPNRRGQNFFFREYIQETLKTQKPVITRPFVTTKTDHHTVLMFSAPIFDKHGNIAAIMAGSLGLTNPQLLGKLSETRLGKTGYFFLTTSDGMMVMHPDKERIMKEAAPRGANTLFDKALYENFQGTEETTNSRDIQMVTSFKRLKTTNWILGANYPKTEAFAPIQHFVTQFIFFTIGSLLLITAVFIYIGHKLIQPLCQLTDNISLAADNPESLEALSPDKRSIEIERLINAFNRFLHNLNIYKNQAQYDPLTKLPNRSLLKDRLEQAVIRADRHKKLIALMFLDLDNFKTINDTYGHEAGDNILKLFAERLQNCVRASDTVARLAGDEFVILSEEIALVDDAVGIARKIIQAMDVIFDLGPNIRIKTSTSIGIVVRSPSSFNAEELMDKADIAMYAAKHQGGRNFSLYQDDKEINNPNNLVIARIGRK